MTGHSRCRDKGRRMGIDSERRKGGGGAGAGEGGKGGGNQALRRKEEKPNKLDRYCPR